MHRRTIEQFRVALTNPKQEMIVEDKEQLARFVVAAKASGTDAVVSRRTMTVETGDWVPHSPEEAS